MESLRPDRDELDQFKSRQPKKKGVNKASRAELAPNRAELASNKVASGGSAGVDSSRASVRVNAAPAQNNSIFSLLLLIFFSPIIRGIHIQVPYIGRDMLLGDYFDSLIFSVHLLFSLPLLSKCKEFLFYFSRAIKWTASLTFSLYLFHRPLIQIFAIFSFQEPSSFSSRVLGGTFLVVVTFGLWCENQKYRIKNYLCNIYVRNLQP